eukprot:9148045-Lingulodinium_polyedra.AAC.1
MENYPNTTLTDLFNVRLLFHRRLHRCRWPKEAKGNRHSDKTNYRTRRTRNVGYNKRVVRTRAAN